MKDSFKTVTQILFLILIFIFVILVNLGFSVDIGVMQTPKFWCQCIINLVIVMMFFNIIFTIDLENRKKRKDCLHYNIVASRQMITKRIKSERLYADLELAIDEENAERYAFECNRLLHKKSVRVDYENILPYINNEVEGKTVDDYLNSTLLGEKTKRKVKKVITKIQNGKVVIQKLDEDSLLRDNDISHIDKDKPIIFNSNTLKMKNNAIKIVTFLIANIVLGVINYSPVMADFWTTLLNNAVLLGSAFTSALVASVNYIKIKTSVYQRQLEFFAMRMNLNDEYKDFEKD